MFLSRLKDNGQNFRVQLPKKDKAVSQLSIPPNVSVPEELVQIQASLNRETNGKQSYTLEQEKASILHISTSFMQLFL